MLKTEKHGQGKIASLPGLRHASRHGGRAIAYVVLCLNASLAFAQAATPPTVSQVGFAPASIQTGGTSSLTIVLGNANAAAATLTAPLLDTLPAGLTVATSGAGGSCTTGAVTANAGNTTIGYGAGATIPAGGCSITVSVKASSNSGATYFTDTIPAGALQTSLGNSPTAASGTLTVHAAIKVPSLLNLTQSGAATALQAAGLVLGTVTRGASTVPYNLVYQQSPASGVAVAAGATVNISISNGPNGVTNPHSALTSVPGGVNPEQVSVAAAIERVCAALQAPTAPALNQAQSNLLSNCKSIINTYGGGSNPVGLNNALEAVSGRQATAQQRSSTQFASLQFANIGSRLSQLRQGASGFSFADLDTGAPMQSEFGQFLAALHDATDGNDPGSSGSGSSRGGSGAPRSGGASGDSDQSQLSRWGFFVNGSLRRGGQESTENETGYDFKSNGITAGADYRFNSHIVAGVAYGHSNGNTDFTDGTGRLDSRSNTVSLYGSYYQDAFYVDFIGTFGHISYDASRTTSYVIDPNLPSVPTNCAGGTVCTIEADASTGARQYSFGGSAGYNFYQGGLVFGPDLALDYTRININGFTESDANNSGMELAYGNQIGESLLLKAGGHVSYAISTPFAVIMPQVRARYIREFKNDQRAVNAHYVDDPTVNSSNGPTSNFVVFTDAPDRNYFDWSAGLTAQFAFGLSAFVDYSAIGQYQYLTAHELSFGVRFQYLVR